MSDNSNSFDIEEYRNLILSDKEEWDNQFNPRKISIEALEKIEKRKRGKGPDKPELSKLNNITGPFYDTMDGHIHIWKHNTKIENFNGEQDPKVKYLQYSDIIPGTYCCICHKKLIQFKFNFKNQDISDPIEKKYEYIKPPDGPPGGRLQEFSNKYKDEPINLNNQKSVYKWKTLLNKVLYTINNQKCVYNISNKKCLLLWPWEMTPYQKFKYNNKNYKDCSVFIKDYTDTTQYLQIFKETD